MRNILILLFILLTICIQKAYSKNFQIGQIVENELEIKRSIKFKLPEGKWEVVRKSTDNQYGISQKIIGIARVENNEVMEVIEVYEGLLAGIYVGYIDQAINEIVFKNKYDGCYEKPEYYFVKFFWKGSSHNCLVVKPLDVFKALNNPDDPEKRGMGAAYNIWLKNNNYVIPSIFLESYHTYFTRLSKGNWYQLTYMANPKIFNSPESKFKTIETTEYNGANINNFPQHKKIMDIFLELSKKRHIEFENSLKAKRRHRLKF